MFRFDVVGVGANSVDYVYRLPRFPQPDSPAAKLRISEHRVTCGGQTATALCTCAAMGLRATYIGTTGSDPNGERMRRELSARGIDLAHASVREAMNPFAVILLDERQGERVVLWDRGPGLLLEDDELAPSLIRGARLLHVDDVDEEAAIRAAQIARDEGLPVTSDIERVTPRTEALVAAVTVPIFAEHAAQVLTGEREVARAIRAVQAASGARMVCVTLGARGAMLLADGRLYHEQACPVETIDTTGAGDVFRGAFIVALLRGDPPEQILRFANAAAAISCTRVGAMASVPTLEETRTLAGL